MRGNYSDTARSPRLHASCTHQCHAFILLVHFCEPYLRELPHPANRKTSVVPLRLPQLCFSRECGSKSGGKSGSFFIHRDVAHEKRACAQKRETAREGESARKQPEHIHHPLPLGVPWAVAARLRTIEMLRTLEIPTTHTAMKTRRRRQRLLPPARD